eukprot:Opistho-2@58854
MILIDTAWFTETIPDSLQLNRREQLQVGVSGVTGTVDKILSRTVVRYSVSIPDDPNSGQLAVIFTATTVTSSRDPNSYVKAAFSFTDTSTAVATTMPSQTVAQGTRLEMALPSAESGALNIDIAFNSPFAFFFTSVALSYTISAFKTFTVIPGVPGGVGGLLGPGGVACFNVSLSKSSVPGELSLGISRPTAGSRFTLRIRPGATSCLTASTGTPAFDIKTSTAVVSAALSSSHTFAIVHVTGVLSTATLPCYLYISATETRNAPAGAVSVDIPRRGVVKVSFPFSSSTTAGDFSSGLLFKLAYTSGSSIAYVTSNLSSQHSLTPISVADKVTYIPYPSTEVGFTTNGVYTVVIDSSGGAIVSPSLVALRPGSLFVTQVGKSGSDIDCQTLANTGMRVQISLSGEQAHVLARASLEDTSSADNVRQQVAKGFAVYMNGRAVNTSAQWIDGISFARVSNESFTDIFALIPAVPTLSCNASWALGLAPPTIGTLNMSLPGDATSARVAFPSRRIANILASFNTQARVITTARTTTKVTKTVTSMATTTSAGASVVAGF